MLQQVNSSYRQQLTSEPLPSHEKHCLSNGMDQGFHNWILHSGTLQRLMRVRIFHQVSPMLSLFQLPVTFVSLPQGEGPVNNIGAFYPGHQALLKFDLMSQWNILRGEKRNRTVVNWNGDPSPVVHQFDRYMYVSLPRPPSPSCLIVGTFIPIYIQI
jgi:hypothetical protein